MNDVIAESARLIRAVDRLVGQVAHWEPGRWSVPGDGAAAVTRGAPGEPGLAGDVRPGEPSRADRVYALVQRLADLGADAEHRPHLPVPRIGDLVLPDQLRVVAGDLACAGDPARAVDKPAKPDKPDELDGEAVRIAVSRLISAAADDVDAVRRTL